MINDITKLAALVSSNLTKVDKNMLSHGNTGAANKINVRDFLAAPPQQSSQQPQYSNNIPAQPPQINHSLAPQGDYTVGQIIPSSIPSTPIDLSSIVNELKNIGGELSKINKKLTSVQKYLNSKVSNEQPSEKLE